jgi:hypothetical protein
MPLILRRYVICPKMNGTFQVGCMSKCPKDIALTAVTLYLHAQAIPKTTAIASMIPILCRWIVSNIVRAIFSGTWIGGKDSLLWPPRNPDLTYLIYAF